MFFSAVLTTRANITRADLLCQTFFEVFELFNYLFIFFVYKSIFGLFMCIYIGGDLMINALCVFYLGCICGSFFYCIAGIWTRAQFRWFARSNCESCHSVLSWFELLPIFSYLIQRGRCRHCHTFLGPSYWWSEFLTGCLFLHGFFNLDAMNLRDLFICFILLLMSYCDLCERWVPDLLQLGLLAVLLYPFTWQQQDVFLFLFSLTTFSLFALIFYTLRRNWIGGADIKLLILLQLALPVLKFPVFLFTASSLGLVFLVITRLYFNNLSKELPFIPFISLAYYIVWIYL